jgi:hypothetical protein
MESHVTIPTVNCCQTAENDVIWGRVDPKFGPTRPQMTSYMAGALPLPAVSHLRHQQNLEFPIVCHSHVAKVIVHYSTSVY